MAASPPPELPVAEQTGSESAFKPSDPQSLPEQQTQKMPVFDAIASKVNARLSAAADRCEDTAEFGEELGAISEEFGLKSIRMIGLGTGGAAVEYRINPRFTWILPSGKLIWRMTGRAAPPQADVSGETETLTIGTASATVGTHMIANPLSPDFEPGSPSSADSAQNGIMSQLANAGNTSVPNDQKYIKGHLLNDNVGGEGEARNLFPITADANAKHLVYVEKFVKAQLAKGYVVYYEVNVDYSPAAPLAPGQYGIDADFQFVWNMLDAHGHTYRTQHKQAILSRFNVKGAEPFDLGAEYPGEYTTLNKSKATPNAIDVGQYKPYIASLNAPSTAIATTVPLTFPAAGLLGHSAAAMPTVADYPAKSANTDKTSGVQYVSVRPDDLPAVAKPFLAPSPPTPFTPFNITYGFPSIGVTVKAISRVGGGWVRLYF